MKPKKLTDRQLEIIAGFATHRGAIDSYTDGASIEVSVLFTVADALELFGHDRTIVNQIAKLIGADDFLGPTE